MGLFDKVRNVAHQMTSMLDEAKVRREIDKHEQSLRDNPENIFVLQELSTLYQESGQTEKAVEVLVRMAETHRKRQSTDLALVAYRQAERLASKEQRLDILRHLIELYIDLKRFDDAYQYIRQAIDKLLTQQQPEAAIALLNGLPPLGKKDQLYRGELLELIKLQQQQQEPSPENSGSWVIPGLEMDTNSGTTKVKEQFPEQTLLLVDDDPEMIELLQTMFQQFGCRIVTARNGQEGLARAAESYPTIIVSDLVMPKMDGSQFFAELRKHPTLSEVPFVCLSSRGQEIERIAALARGVEEYWVKPFNPPEILLRMRNLLKRLRPPADIAGRLSEISTLELLQFLDSRHKTGVVTLRSKPHKAWIYLKDGRVVDAVMNDIQGRMVIYRAVYWLIGDFEFRTSHSIPAVDTIGLTTHTLLVEAMRRYDQAQRVMDSLPDFSHIYKCSVELKDLISTDEEFSANINRIMFLFDGRRTLGECVSLLTGDLETLVLVHSLIEQLLLVPQME